MVRTTSYVTIITLSNGREYTRSKGDDYETFEGTPEEIAKLVRLIDKKPSKTTISPISVTIPRLGSVIGGPLLRNEGR